MSNRGTTGRKSASLQRIWPEFPQRIARTARAHIDSGTHRHNAHCWMRRVSRHSCRSLRIAKRALANRGLKFLKPKRAAIRQRWTATMPRRGRDSPVLFFVTSRRAGQIGPRRPRKDRWEARRTCRRNVLPRANETKTSSGVVACRGSGTGIRDRTLCSPRLRQLPDQILI